MARVLIATDGSDLAVHAAHTALRLMGDEHTWTVLAVVQMRTLGEGIAPVSGIVPPVLDPGAVAAVDDAMTDNAREAARSLAAEIPGAQTHVVRGDPGAAICEVAADDFDLIVVGSHGAGLVRRVLVGSVSSYVVGHAPCPVLVVRSEVGEPD